MPDFLKDAFGDPFVSEEMRDFTSSLGDSDNENDENIDEADEEELEQIKSALEEEDGSSKIFSQTIQQQPPDLQTDVSPAKKKRPGRPSKKMKKDQTSENNGLEENMVSSSSQEPRVASIAVQTPSKLLKDLLSNSSKISKDELRQLKEKVKSRKSRIHTHGGRSSTIPAIIFRHKHPCLDSQSCGRDRGGLT